MLVATLGKPNICPPSKKSFRRPCFWLKDRCLSHFALSDFNCGGQRFSARLRQKNLF